MKLKNTMNALAAALLITMAPAINAAPPAAAAQTVVHKSFATPEDAARALADAVRAQDVKSLLNVVGPASRSWLSSGDEVADREIWRKFLVEYDRKHSISQVADGRAILLVGDGDWPFPAPLVRQGDGWIFDSAAGREEVINRRDGRNELDAIQTLLAIVDAQREYAAALAGRCGRGSSFRKYELYVSYGSRRYIGPPTSGYDCQRGRSSGKRYDKARGQCPQLHSSP